MCVRPINQNSHSKAGSSRYGIFINLQWRHAALKQKAQDELAAILERIEWLQTNRHKLDTHKYAKFHREFHKERALWDPYRFIETIIGYPDLHEPLHRPMIEGVAWDDGRWRIAVGRIGVDDGICEAMR